jgi:hypothetical protein
MRKAAVEPSTGDFLAEKDADENDHNTSKKGPAKRLPRARRHAQTRIKKL